MAKSVCTPAEAGREQHFWERALSIWHGVFALGVLSAVLATYTTYGLSQPRGIAIFCIIIGLAIWYAATGARALGRDRPRLGYLYIAGLVPAFAALVALDPSMGYLMFVVVPQIFVFLDRIVVAYAAVTGLVLLYGAILIATLEEVREQPWALILTLGISLAFSLLFGGWIHGIIEQSAKRAELIAELERTRAELAAERHEAGMLTERARLAAEIHDTLAQGFTSILMLTQAAEANPDTTRESLALIERTARENLAEARSLVAALAPVALDGSTLPEALRRLADQYREDTHADVRLTVNGTPAPDPDTDVVLLRAAQETLANVRKHARARSVDLRLDYRPDGVTLAVADDGRGFEPTQNGSGYGLQGMRRRAEQSGGTMTVTSKPGAGTTVEVALP
jgi:signal transduction histidine kinase